MSARLLRIPATAIALLLSLLLVPAALGQSAQFQLLADIPFGFHVNGKLLPAGTYRISPMLNTSILVASIDPSGPGAAAITSFAGGGSIHERSELLFHRYGDKYFLRQIWRAGLETGLAMPVSRPEREVLFRAANPVERIYVAARQAR